MRAFTQQNREILAQAPHSMPFDLLATREHIRQGLANPMDELARSLQVAQADICRNTFVKTDFDAAAQAAAAGAHKPLAGLSVSVKDLFDVAGQRTMAGSAVLADAPPAETDAPAVARLKAAGA